ncbi:alpha/beta hydrolase [Microbacterium sp. H1-D42]|uniref:alpha/beta fold hydrolase n=1 Tax=Microbacterium sp. H1-D42 TaxID=2925844 RepID=UPI001F53D52E|nr:alpha/beta hydrolase [Microbacterium sp. H1-D42]UNK70278.1 alpha/beta hydrolase [Microbacterium sp. H1-D42]
MPDSPEMPGAGLLDQDVFVETADGRMLRTMISNGGLSHAELRGEGDDLIVLEAGLGMSGLSWGPVQQRIAPHARVVAYERAGYGASTPDTAPRDLDRLTDDLLAVIRSVPHRRLVLVGHSWGGAIVRSAAARLLADGADVAGLVLVDQSDENAAVYFSAAFRFGVGMQRGLLPLLARLRALRPMMSSMVAAVDEPLRDAVLEASTSTAAARAAAEEYRRVVAGLTTLRDSPLDLGRIPITVISGLGRPKHGARQRAEIVAAHQVSASQHPGARFVGAERSEHLIPFTEPQLVADEALALLAR